MATLPLDFDQWDPQLVVPYHMNAGGALADTLGAAGAGSGYTPASFETSAALLEALESTSTNAVAAFGMVERPGCTMFYNMSVVAATPLAVRLLDAAYLAQLDPTLSLSPSAALLPLEYCLNLTDQEMVGDDGLDDLAEWREFIERETGVKLTFVV